MGAPDQSYEQARQALVHPPSIVPCFTDTPPRRETNSHHACRRSPLLPHQLLQATSSLGTVERELHFRISLADTTRDDGRDCDQ